MRSFRLLLITIALLVCLQTVTAAPRHGLARRQDDDESTASATTANESSQPTATSHSRQSSTAPSEADQQSTTKESAASSTASVTSTTVSSAPSPSATTNGTESGAVLDDPLPLHPKITPALGLIGALFLTTGALYGIVGIKSKWIYVFGSAAYLAALAVTVLIVYLMSPPVSNAIQGAFFVAAFVTGALFGALALIFPDLTEGLGCLLGGFCVSMWFLSLKEGGLIASTGGRAIFIGCFSAAGYCLSFSRHTRTYGLIGSISFSGATIAMLGVDCFSRAGWKEFWLYLWNLNPDVFPLNTTTYPMTKGLKAELAGVVILTVFGVVSQLRVWRLINERRNKREEQEQEAAQSQRMQEEELGRTIEDKFQRERRDWEATYGGGKGFQSTTDSSGLTTPQTPSLLEKEYSESKTDLSRAANKQTSVTVMPVQEEEEEKQQMDGLDVPAHKDGVATLSADISRANSRANSARPSSEAVGAPDISRSVSATSSLKPSSRPPPPAIVPLPFRVPQEDSMSLASDNASVSAIADTEEVPAEDSHSMAGRFSGKPTMKRISTAASSWVGFQVEDVVMMSQDEDDRASSMAATLDDEVSLRELSPPQSPVDGPLGSEQSSGEAEKSKASETDVGEVGQQSLTVSTDPKLKVEDDVQSPRSRHDTLVKGGSDKSSRSGAASSSSQDDDKVGSVAEDLSTGLPTRLSKVAQSYRTNEWAKHLEAADKPEVDDMAEPSSPGTQLDHERPAPVSEGISQPFAVTKRASKRVSSDSNMSMAKRASKRVSSDSNMNMAHRNKAFAQINSNAGGRRVSSDVAQLPSQTLMGKRESLMRNRVTSQNLNMLTSNTTVAVSEDENMTLAQRRRALKQKHQKPPSASQKWQKNSWAAPVPSDEKREEQQRVAMMLAKRQREVEQQQQAMVAQQRESLRYSMMRSHEMQDAHREAMRRMQAAANKA